MTGATKTSMANTQSGTIKLPLAVKGSAPQVPSSCATCVVKACQSQRQ